MIILMTLLIAGTSMAFAVQQWWRGLGSCSVSHWGL
jgi:hypothetical protein